MDSGMKKNSKEKDVIQYFYNIYKSQYFPLYTPVKKVLKCINIFSPIYIKTHTKKYNIEAKKRKKRSI